MELVLSLHLAREPRLPPQYLSWLEQARLPAESMNC